MKKYLFVLVLFSYIHYHAQNTAIKDHVIIKVYTSQDGNETKGAPMPELKEKSILINYQRRFDYLLINVPEIHSLGKFKERKEIFDLYPDTLKMKRLYLEAITNDKKLAGYFEEAAAPITHAHAKAKKTYTVNELTDVASKFFYCDKVNPDTSVQSHVCIGINGLKETKWKKDYTLLAAFCFEAIFNDFDKDTSRISKAFDAEKSKSCKQYRDRITTLSKYLEDVKLDLFNRMKNNTALKEELLAYYELNKKNLAFEIIR